MSHFTLDVERIRAEARRKMEEGAVTPHYKADRAAVIQMLSSALATEWICVLRYSQHKLTAQGIHAEAVAAHFGEHADQEHQHAMEIAERITQLGGTPSLDPRTLAARSHAEYKECESLTEMIQENLVAERIAIDSYAAMIRFLGDSDPTTRTMLERILATEEEHADDMASLLAAIDPREKTHH